MDPADNKQITDQVRLEKAEATDILDQMRASVSPATN